MCCCDSGHQPERRSETENLCGQSSLPEHQHRLLGEILKQKIRDRWLSLSRVCTTTHWEGIFSDEEGVCIEGSFLISI